MTEPIIFTHASPRHDLPLLFVGQVQKEFYVNEAHARIDALLHPAVEEVANDPPASPDDGQCWLAGTAPTGTWSGHPGHLACFSAGSWLLVAPTEGMRVYDKSSASVLLHRAGHWAGADAVSLPVGGTTVDTQARAAIEALVAALQSSGIIPHS